MLSNKETDKSLDTLVEEAKLELSTYVVRRIRLFKLDAFEKLGISASSLGYGVIVLFILAFLVFFILVGMAFFIGELLNSLAAGFGIMALFSLFVLFIVFLCRKIIKQSILNGTITFLRGLEEKEDDNEEK
ncbi:phage holin family protein [Prevotella sp. 10(H)]|uniref:phage holin family protein n=1 Tax=Prevotella sp. 10(H) TaxID=1158294 RepID=UPI0004A73ACD|nr:phage holin family protein [Prevotella sp. 10(H)]